MTSSDSGSESSHAETSSSLQSRHAPESERKSRRPRRSPERTRRRDRARRSMRSMRRPKSPRRTKRRKTRSRRTSSLREGSLKRDGKAGSGETRVPAQTGRRSPMMTALGRVMIGRASEDGTAEEAGNSPIVIGKGGTELQKDKPQRSRLARAPKMIRV